MKTYQYKGFDIVHHIGDGIFKIYKGKNYYGDYYSIESAKKEVNEITERLKKDKLNG